MNTGVIILTILALVVIVAIVICVLGKGKSTNYDINSITYSVSGGFGLPSDLAERRYTINSNGTVVFTNKYDSLTETHHISDEQFKKLCDYINEKGSIFDKKLDDGNATDGISRYITIKLASGEEKTVGGYMIINNNFDDIIDKVKETIGSEKISNYSSRIGK